MKKTGDVKIIKVVKVQGKGVESKGKGTEKSIK